MWKMLHALIHADFVNGSYSSGSLHEGLQAKACTKIVVTGGAEWLLI